MARPIFDPRAWFDQAGDHERYLREAIIQDPEIQEAVNISVSIEREGILGGKKVVHLIGKTGQAHDRERAEEIVADNTNPEAEIVNEIVVEREP